MNVPEVEFRPFMKIARLNRDVVVTEKIDGTNGLVYVSKDGAVHAGSRSQWITPEKDNHGFAKWVEANADSLRLLGPGFHYGEWWGKGINRRHPTREKAFSLFNVRRWTSEAPPACCSVVPVLWQGNYKDLVVNDVIESLRANGSVADPDCKSPEGIVVFHSAGQVLFKVTLENDESPKTLSGGQGV